MDFILFADRVLCRGAHGLSRPKRLNTLREKENTVIPRRAFCRGISISLRLNIKEEFLTAFGITMNRRVAQPLLAVCTLQHPHGQECLCYSNIRPSDFSADPLDTGCVGAGARTRKHVGFLSRILKKDGIGLWRIRKMANPIQFEVAWPLLRDIHARRNSPTR